MESLLTAEELVSAVKGFSLNGKNECVFTSVQTDSRLIEKDSLFVPLIGEFQNGHKYIPQAIEKGASVVFVASGEYNSLKEKYNQMAEDNNPVLFVVVENTLNALQNAAEAYVAKFPDLLKIAITGSCGKTTTKEMMVSVAKAHFGEDSVVYTKGNFNSETGLPLSVFQIRKNHTCGIFEMGMNRVNEIGEISAVLKANFAIITNIGTAHIGILGSRENIALEKRKAFNYISETGAAFVPAEDDFADFCTENVKGAIIKFGKNVKSEDSGVVYIKDKGILGTEFTVDGVTVNLPIIGEYNYINCLGVTACARKIGILPEEIKKGLESMSSVSGRMEIKEADIGCGENKKKVILVKDFYNANPDSMKKGIDFVGNLTDYPEKIFILADMKELGKEAKKAHKEIGQVIDALCADENKKISVFLIGTDMKSAFKILEKSIKKSAGLKNLFWNKTNNAEDFASIKKDVLSVAVNNSIIMFKGSHSMNLKKLCEILLEAENG